mgnify:CR=1 FL=1
MMKTKETNTMRVYCGPSIRGVIRQYTSFTGELPDRMKKLIEPVSYTHLTLPTKLEV